MKVKLYYTFQEFAENWNNDLDYFISKYPEAIEKDFAKVRLEGYSYWIDLNNNNKLNEFSRIIDAELLDIVNGGISDDKVNLDFLIHCLNNTDNECIKYIRDNSQRFIDGTLTPNCLIRSQSTTFKSMAFKFFPFFVYNSKDRLFSINTYRLKSFRIALNRIEEFLNNKINNPENEISQIKLNQNSDLPVKVKMIILNELGIIEFLKKDKGYINADIARILQPISINARNKYIENMLTHLDNYNHNMCPYKSKKNVQQALIELNNMGLALEQTKYLNDLSKTNPDLFD